MNILIVDDERPVLDLLAMLCERDGHDVTTAESAWAALAILRKTPFDVLITDIVMPGLDGLALIRRAKAMHPDLMPIVITGHAGQYSLEDVVEAGASDLMLKPFRAPELRARLKLIADQRKTVEQLRARTKALQDSHTHTVEELQRELNESRQNAARLAAIVERGEQPV